MILNILFGFLVTILIAPSLTLAQIPIFALKSHEALKQAVTSSARLNSARLDVSASENQANSAHSSLLPKLTLEGFYRYQTNVPSISMPIPNAPPIQFGDYNNYSVGPTLSYTLFDGGRLRQTYLSQLKFKESKEADQKLIRLDVESAVMSAYIRTQLGLEQIKTVSDSLALSESQDHEVTLRFKAGSSSELDLLTAHQDVLNYKLKFKQTQAELASSLRDLLALTGDDSVPDPSRPAPQGTPNASVWIELESLEDSVKSQAKQLLPEPEQNQPRILGQSLRAEALALSAQALGAANYPVLVLAAQSTYGYPNGPLLQNVNQNTFTATFSMPIWEFNRTHLLSAQKEAEAESAQSNKNQLRIDLVRDFRKAKDHFLSLREQEQISLTSIETAQRSAKLYYQSYKAGRLNLVDVQAANNRALQAKFNLEQTRALILTQLISMHSLSGKGFLE